MRVYVIANSSFFTIDSYYITRWSGIHDWNTWIEMKLKSMMKREPMSWKSYSPKLHARWEDTVRRSICATTTCHLQLRALRCRKIYEQSIEITKRGRKQQAGGTKHHGNKVRVKSSPIRSNMYVEDKSWDPSKNAQASKGGTWGEGMTMDVNKCHHG